MDIGERIQRFVNETPALAAGDPRQVFRGGRRRVWRRRVVAASGTAAVVMVAVALVGLPGRGGTQLPVIGDTPEFAHEAVPDGWQTVTAGEIAVSIPPDWEISRPYEDFEPPDGAALGGPCLADLHSPQGLGGEPTPDVPVAVVYDRPTDGACNAIGFSGPPPRPGLVLYEGIRTDAGETGWERHTHEKDGERDRIGQLDVWRVIDDEPVSDLEASGIASYVPVELSGGLMVSHPDDPIVQRVLATARPAEIQGEGGPVAEQPRSPDEESSSSTDVERNAPQSVEPTARVETPDGEAVVELVVDPPEVGIDEPVSFWLANRGEVDLLYGLHFAVERWEGKQWVEVPWPEDYGAPDVLESLPAGEESTVQRWPFDDRPHAESGWYRITWPASWEDEPDYEQPDMEIDVTSQFEVHE